MLLYMLFNSHDNSIDSLIYISRRGICGLEISFPSSSETASSFPPCYLSSCFLVAKPEQVAGGWIVGVSLTCQKDIPQQI